VRTEAPSGAPGRLRSGAILGGMAALPVLLAWGFGLTAPLDLRLQDALLRLGGERPTPEPIAIVEIDDATIRAYGRWPIPRDQHALLLEALSTSGARAVGFDILFVDPDRYNVLNDDVLAAQTAAFPGVVHALSFQGGNAEGVGAPWTTEPDFLERASFAATDVPASPAGAGLLPVPALRDAGAAFGHVSVVTDVDGVIRRFPPWLRQGDRLVPSLALRLALLARSDAWPPIVGREGTRVVVGSAGAPRALGPLPVDGRGALRIRYRGDRQAFPGTYSYVDVLRSWATSDTVALRRAFEGTIVLVGSTATGEAAADVGVTPFSSSTPRIYAQANALDALLRGDFLREPPAWMMTVSLLLLGMTLGALVGRLAPLSGLLLALGTCAAGALAVAGLLTTSGLALPPVPPLVLPVLVLIVVGGHQSWRRHRRLEEEGRELQAARRLQADLLPGRPPARTDLDVFGVAVPSREVGGDYYDWVEGDDGTLHVVIADVSGKGMSAALLMANVQASFRAQVAAPGSSLAGIVEAMHRALRGSTTSGRFATLFLARFPAHGDRFEYCSAGHDPAILLHEGRVAVLGPTGDAVGAFEDSRFTGAAATLPPGGWLVLYSDGVTEARGVGEVLGEDGLTIRLLDLSRRADNARELTEALMTQLREFRRGGAFDDDVTLVVIRRPKGDSLPA
jgi:CHASE2 domain-containing sensor protein